jgi:hypothetical protein
MAKYNFKGPVDAVQYVDGLAHPNIGCEVEIDDHVFPVLYHEGNSGDYDVLVEDDWIVTTVDGRNFTVDEFLFDRLFEEVK